ncbi:MULTISPECIES: hypothetical protein [Cyanophyceae]|nr:MULTISPECIES: hypothetical protein [unclassified Coleofasciculus]
MQVVNTGSDRILPKNPNLAKLPVRRSHPFRCNKKGRDRTQGNNY